MEEVREAREEYIASFKESVQISPDSWQVSIRTKKCNKDTTIREIMEWSFWNNVEISKSE